MQRARDSLTPLLEKRRVERQNAEHALARAIASHDAATQTVERAQQALAAHTAKRPEPALESAPAESSSGSSLARAAAFGQRHADTSARLKQALMRAHAHLASLTADLEVARQKLARASAGERALEQHQARLEHEAAQRAEHRDQDAADEQAAAQIIAQKEPGL